MINKRALVVDDSRAARVVLTRTLESLGITVDAVESAELALDYLYASQPDVIFMDHLMTGMDGLAAVRVIKANPRTANIPVFMYTSQSESAFVHAARIAGALGVLPKTFKQHDVINILQQVRFAARNSTDKTPSSDYAGIPAHAKLTLMQRIALPLLGISVLVCIGWLTYSNYQLQQQLKLSQRVETAASAASSTHSQASLRMATMSASTGIRVVAIDSETVPYGEVPLAGSRLDRLRSMINTLHGKAFKGAVRVEVFTGDFCLQGNSTEGFRVAEATLPIKQCDLLGNPFADVLSVQQRQSTTFTNFLTTINQDSDIHVQLADGGRQLATPYPAQLPGLKAGEWNLSAARNNRVEFTASTE
jgi:CheY-like chemotaxis protein